MMAVNALSTNFQAQIKQVEKFYGVNNDRVQHLPDRKKTNKWWDHYFEKIFTEQLAIHPFQNSHSFAFLSTQSPSKKPRWEGTGLDDVTAELHRLDIGTQPYGCQNSSLMSSRRKRRLRIVSGVPQSRSGKLHYRLIRLLPNVCTIG